MVSIQKKGDKVTASYKWQSDVEEFTMPVKVTTAPGKMELIYPNTKKYQTIDVVGLHPDDFSVAEDQYLVDVRIWKTYIEERK
jgi:hypothetical protein